MEGKKERDKRTLTAGIIIVGDEILKGHVQDTNSHYLCKQLWQLGVKVGKISVVSDDFQSIADEVKLFSPQYDFVFTTGGIGPTHDDITLEAVGKAFGEDVCLHPEMLKFLFGDEKNDDPTNAWRKMAIVPRSTKVHIRPNTNGDFAYLLMEIHNVHCYPGVPSLFRGSFQAFKDLYSSSSQFYLREVFFSCGEGRLAKPLNTVQEKFPSVQIGSYPNVTPNTNHQVRVTLESSNKEQVEKAYTRLFFSLPLSSMMSSKSNYDTADGAARKSLGWFLERLVSNQDSLVPHSLCQKMLDSINTLEKSLQDYSFEEMCVAFNGGKDCTLILELLHCLLKWRKHNFQKSKIKVLYVIENKTFPEISHFVEQSIKRYNLEVIKLSGSIQQALLELKTTHPNVKAIFMGTRYTDPFSGDLKPFSPTDSSWPEYMRVNCILDWTYTDVWLFLRLFQVPYCSLYDHGYTSLDGMLDTHQNPALLVKSPAEASESRDGKNYLPAYMLGDEGLERAGRTQRTKAGL